MAFTTADLTRLDRAIVSNTLKVVVDGHEVQYRSMDELLKARTFVAEQIAIQTTGNAGGWFSFNPTNKRDY
jgi:hypothetical protein